MMARMGNRKKAEGGKFQIIEKINNTEFLVLFLYLYFYSCENSLQLTLFIL